MCFLAFCYVTVWRCRSTLGSLWNTCLGPFATQIPQMLRCFYEKNLKGRCCRCAFLKLSIESILPRHGDRSLVLFRGSTWACNLQKSGVMKWSSDPHITSLDFPSSPPKSTATHYVLLNSCLKCLNIVLICTKLIDLYSENWFVTKSPGSPCVTSADIGLVSLLSCSMDGEFCGALEKATKKVWHWFKKHSPKRKMILCDLIL